MALYIHKTSPAAEEVQPVRTVFFSISLLSRLCALRAASSFQPDWITDEERFEENSLLQLKTSLCRLPFVFHSDQFKPNSF